MSLPPGPEAIPESKLRLLFALLFSSPEPVGMDRIREILFSPPGEVPGVEEGDPGPEAEAWSPRQCLEALEEWMAARDLPLRLHASGRRFRLLTSEEVADRLVPVRRKVHAERLGPAALEVLSLVAYRQPVLKADLDAIRGVKSGSHLRHLLDLRLIRIKGRADLPGHPFLYVTTQDFLDRFGLRSLDELPEAQRLAAPVEARVGAAPGE